MDDLDAALRHEFDAEPGSFLLALRCDLKWSKPGFLRLVGLMQRYIEREAARPVPEQEALARWAAEGFWYLSHFVRDWATHPDFPKVGPPGYEDRAFERLDALATWYFTSQSPLLSGTLPPFEG